MPAGSSVVITPAPIPFSLSQRIWPPIAILVGLLATRRLDSRSGIRTHHAGWTGTLESREIGGFGLPIKNAYASAPTMAAGTRSKKMEIVRLPKYFCQRD